MSINLLLDTGWKVDSTIVPPGKEGLLLQPIKWLTNRNGKVVFKFITGYVTDGEDLRVENIEFDPKDMQDGYGVLNRIYYFLNVEQIDLFYVLERLWDKGDIINFLRNKQIGPYHRIDSIPKLEGLYFKGLFLFEDEECYSVELRSTL